jgi:hypothetical protein
MFLLAASGKHYSAGTFDEGYESNRHSANFPQNRFLNSRSENAFAGGFSQDLAGGFGKSGIYAIGRLTNLCGADFAMRRDWLVALVSNLIGRLNFSSISFLAPLCCIHVARFPFHTIA